MLSQRLGELGAAGVLGQGEDGRYRATALARELDVPLALLESWSKRWWRALRRQRRRVGRPET